MKNFQSHGITIDKQESNVEKLKEYIELLEAAFNYSEAGFTLSNANGKVLKINSSQIHITGHQPEMTLGRSMGDIEKENNNQSATMQVVMTKKPVIIQQNLPSGKSYLVYGKPFFDENEKLKYVICTLIDNTQHSYILKELEKTKINNLLLNETVHKLANNGNLQNTLIYCSKKMQGLINMCAQIAPFDSTVLIFGESGVGKELVSDYIVEKSNRKNKPYIKINCSAIPETLLESELFGYEPGAFTNASKHGKAGIFETANGGTLLLDEIGELPPSLQAKLLRFLQDGEFYHVGGTSPINADIRIIAATNCNLESMIKNDTFRKDLYYRLSVLQVVVPTLKERNEDIYPLVRHFLSIFNNKYNLQKSITLVAIEYLRNLTFEGNVRELKNVIERTAVLSKDKTIDILDVKNALSYDYDSPEKKEDLLNGESTGVSLKSIVCRYEKDLLQKFWDEYGSATKIAKILHTSQPTISRKLGLYGII